MSGPDVSGPFARFVGVGLGVDVHSPPDWRALLTSEIPCDFFEVYTRGELAGAEAIRAAAGDLPLLYHDDALDPAFPAPPDAGLLETCAANMRAVGAPWCVSELATRRLGERYLDFFQPMLLNEEAARACADNMRRLDAALPGRVVAENPPYQLPVGPWHVLDALAWVTEEARIPCVLDLGHLLSFQLCRGLEPLSGLDGFPLERVWELHVRDPPHAAGDARRGRSALLAAARDHHRDRGRRPGAHRATGRADPRRGAGAARRAEPVMSLLEDMLALERVRRRPADLEREAQAHPVLQTVDPQRLRAVSASFARHVLGRWWQPRFGATFAQVADPAALATALIAGDAFEAAVGEDETAAVLILGVLALREAGRLDAPE